MDKNGREKIIRSIYKTIVLSLLFQNLTLSNRRCHLNVQIAINWERSTEVQGDAAVIFSSECILFRSFRSVIISTINEQKAINNLRTKAREMFIDWQS